MNKRINVRGIIVKENKIYFIHRIKNKEDYYVFPGGGLENTETIQDGLERELKEEINIKVDIIKELYQLEREESIDHYILCNHKSGHFGVSDGPEYTSPEYKDRGQYIPCSLNIEELEQYNIVPEIIKKALIDDISKGINLDQVDLKTFYL